MKSREYAKRYDDDINSGRRTVLEAMNLLVTTFFEECFDVLLTRNPKTHRGLASAYKEFKSKWQAVCRKITSIHGVKEEGFDYIMEKHHPELFKAFQNSMDTHRMNESIRRSNAEHRRHQMLSGQ